MNKRFLLAVLVGSMVMAGTGSRSAAAQEASMPPRESTLASAVPTPAAKPELPDVYEYFGIFGGKPGLKPWNWRDVADDPTFNATIRTCANAQSANITRVSGGRWGKVSTFAILPNPFSYMVRIFVPSHSNSVTWKLVAQELGGSSHSQVIQESTGKTGYFEYDISRFLRQNMNNSFELEIVVEGAVGEYVEVAELYVYNPEPASGTAKEYWGEKFGMADPLAKDARTAGWLDATTNPDFNCTITNLNQQGCIKPVAPGGKVVGPMIPWKATRCTALELGVVTSNQSEYDPGSFSVVIQEQAGAYRRWVLDKTYHLQAGNHAYPWWSVDLSPVKGMTDGTPFSVAIEGVQQTLTLSYIKLF
jgi:hypothetical protein